MNVCNLIFESFGFNSFTISKPFTICLPIPFWFPFNFTSNFVIEFVCETQSTTTQTTLRIRRQLEAPILFVFDVLKFHFFIYLYIIGNLICF